MTQHHLDLDTPPAGYDLDAIVGDLNTPQRDAVLTNDGPVLVLAGAGSGKTRALTRKIACLVLAEDYAPWEILAVTFTNKAAAEMRERCTHLLGDRADALWLGTFHSIGVRMLRRHGELVGLPKGFVIYDQADQLTMVNRCMKALNISDKVYPSKRFQNFINTQKQECRGPAHPEVPSKGPFERKAQQLYALYTERMFMSGATDFADLIFLPWRLVTELPAIAIEYQQRWRYVLVDEFQDTNRAQYQLLRAVLNPDQHLCVVGDDDQSIYRWRGADVGNILGFDQDFPNAKVIRLEQNYRSSGHILAIPGALIAQNRERHGKTLWTDRGDGDPVRLYEAQSERHEAEYVCRRIRALRGEYDLGEMAIFYRTNAQSRSFEEVLRSHGLPYRVVGGLKFYERAEIKDVVAYLKLLVAPSDMVAFERVINTTPGIGKTSLQKVMDHAVARGLSPWQAACELAATSTNALAKKLVPLVERIIELTATAASQSALEVVEAVLESTGYLKRLELDGTVESDTRAENVRELVAGIAAYCDRPGESSLAGYLDEVALLADIDRAELDDDAVVMMTAHTAKGLEYDVVFVTGLEDDLFPHFNSQETVSGIEEERRLCYVAMTRARHQLHLSHAASRRRFGQVKITTPTRFLDGLPSHVIHREAGSYKRPNRGGYGGARRGNSATFGGGVQGRPAPDPFAQDIPDYETFSQDPGDSVGVGSMVFHPKFGEGRILDISGQGERAKVQVTFEDGSTRRLIAKVLTPV